MLFSVVKEWYTALNSTLTWSTVCGHLLVILASWIVYLWAIKPFLSPLRKMPGLPYRNPIFGSMRDAMKGEAMESTLGWIRKYGTVIRYYFFFGGERVLVANPKAMKRIFVTNSKNYIKPPDRLKVIKNIFGNGILVSNGAEHAAARKLCNPSFKIMELKKMVPIFYQHGQNLRDYWNTNKEKDSLDNDPPIKEVAQDLSRTTLDVIGDSVFNYTFGSLKAPDDPVSCSFNRILSGFGLSWKSVFPILRNLPTATNKKFSHDLKMIKSTVGTVINAREKLMQEADDKASVSRDLLNSLMRAQDDETGIGLSSQELRDNVLTFMFAGHETTSVGLSWCLLKLAEHPEIQEKAREDARRFLPQDGAPITWELVEKMEYINCVVKETLRLCPPVPLVLRQNVKDDVLEGYDIPAGTVLLISIGCMMRLDEYWKDPEEFIPERFQDETNIDPYQFLPFVTGSRICIGYKFALLEMKTILAVLLRDLKFSCIPDVTYKRKSQITMKPDPSLRLIVSKA